MLSFLILIMAQSYGCVHSNYAVVNNCGFAAHSPSITPVIPDGLGVNIGFTDPRPGEMKLLSEAGFRWVRMDFVWQETEKERGRYDFSAYDRLMAALEPYHIRALFILDYGNRLYGNGLPPRTEEVRQAFTLWAAAAAKHFSGRGVLWEIYNEPNQTAFWSPRPNVNEYVELALAVGRAFRAETPNEKLIGPATSGIDFPFLEACFKAGLLDYWSAVSVHPYLRSDPEVVVNDYCRLRELIAAYAPNKAASRGDGAAGTSSNRERVIPIISGEWGYSSKWRGMDERKQGELFAREMLTNLANDIPNSVWYDWHDDGLDPNEPEHHFGIVSNLYRENRDPVYDPKPAYLAAKTLTMFFSGYKFEKRLDVGSTDDYVVVFRNGSNLRIAAWTTAYRAHQVLIPLGPGQYTGVSDTGESTGVLTADPKGLPILLSTAPVYLVATGYQPVMSYGIGNNFINN